MSYQEDLEKRVEELEEEVKFLSKVGEEAFLFRRIEKIIDSNIKKMKKEKDSIQSGENDELGVVERKARTCSDILTKISVYYHIKKDIELTREDMRKYDLKQLLSEDFFRF